MIPDVVVKKELRNVIATGVSSEEYMEEYAAHFCEWVEGKVIKLSPIHERHDELSRFLVILFAAYFGLREIGQLRAAPFVMRGLPGLSKREPDIQVILKSNPVQPQPTIMDGPADICIEIVSPGSEAVDRGDKFIEYQQSGVTEYWMLDPLRREALFYRLNEAGIYIPQYPAEAGTYHTPLLPDFAFHVPTLWRSPLPDFFSVAAMVKAMVE